MQTEIKAGALYKKYQLPLTGMEAVTLPSTSPANAAWSFERLMRSMDTDTCKPLEILYIEVKFTYENNRI